MAEAAAIRARAVPRTRVSTAEQVFAILSLIVLAGGVFPLIQKDSSGDTSTLSLAALAICCVAAATLLHSRGGGIFGAASQLDIAVPLLLGIIALSVFWSDQPTVTARRVFAVLLYTLFGLYLLDRFPLREQPWLLARACAVAAVASIIVAILPPKYGVLPGSGGEWRGIFVQKNVLGRAMAVGVLAAVFSTLMAARQPQRRWVSLAMAAICGLVLLKSSSVFAVVSMVTIVAPIALLLVLRSRFPFRQCLVVVLFVICGTGIVYVIRDWSSLLATVGKDSGLTGRVQLWSSCWHALMQRPLFGYGYGAFWHGWSPPSTQVLLDNPWGPPNAHNGALDLALGIGVVGAALWVVVLAGSIWRAVRGLIRHPNATSLWPLGLPLLVLSYNVTEVTTTSNGFFWALLVAVSTALCMTAREEAARRVVAGRPVLRPATSTELHPV